MGFHSVDLNLHISLLKMIKKLFKKTKFWMAVIFIDNQQMYMTYADPLTPKKTSNQIN